MDNLWRNEAPNVIHEELSKTPVFQHGREVPVAEFGQADHDALATAVSAAKQGRVIKLSLRQHKKEGKKMRSWVG